jgi:hypothetical protein
VKNKALTYGLLIVVALVWYQVFFRVKGNFFGEEEEIVQPITAVNELPSLARDTVELNLNYSDPFGLTRRKPSNINFDGAITRPQSPPRQKPQTIWPVIKYYGLVKKSNSTKPLAIVSVDGIQLMLRTGDEVFDGIYIVKIERDLIKIRYKKETKEIFK